MKKYRVDVRGRAWVKGVVEVDAQNQEDALFKATDTNTGDILWEYDGYDDDTHVTASDVREVT